ncbi:MAG: hypothetical protein RRX93_07860 [Bacteroidales bacterium]
MQAIKITLVEPNQTIYDLALQHYGTVAGIVDILSYNPDLKNDKLALSTLGIDTVKDNDFYFDAPVEIGFPLKINKDSKYGIPTITREFNAPITTYNI